MHAKPVLAWCLAALAATTLACTTSENPGARAEGGSGGAGGTGGEGGEGGTEPAVGPTVAALEHLGSFRPGPARAVLSLGNRNLDVIGHAGADIDPTHFGLDIPVGDAHSVIYGGGFSVLDRTTGQVRFYDAADGVPEVTYTDGTIVFGTGTAPIFAMAWVEQDRVFAAAAWDSVVVGTFADDGSLSFASTKLRAPGAEADAFIPTLTAIGGEIWAGTDQGLAVLDPTTLAVDRWADVGPALAAPFIWDLTATDLNGPTVAAVLGTFEMPTHLAVVGPSATSVLELDGGQIPTTVGAIPGAIVVGVREADGRGSLQAIYPTLEGGYAIEPFLSADAFRTPENPRIIPAKLVHDAGRGLLLVGGSFVDDSSSQPIALVTVDLAAELVVRDVLKDSRDPYYWAMPWNVDAITVDALGRWYVAGRSLCSHVSTKQLGLYRYEFTEDGAFRIVRPWVSGVRSIDVDPVNGDTWLGLKDAIPQLSCFGAAVQTGICRLKADGSCELWTPKVNTEPGGWVALPPMADLAFGDPAHEQLALASPGGGLFLRYDDATRPLNPTSDPATSLKMTRLAWGDDGDLWIGSRSTWAPMPDFTDEQNDAMDSRMPHGLGYLKVGPEAFPVRDTFRRYSRTLAVDWRNDYDTAGMPSNTALDVLALPGPQHALAACGVEREDMVYDHILPEPSPKNVSGGIAEIEGEEVRTFAPPAGLAFGDVVALARRADGAVFALDAAVGVLALDLEARTTALFAAAPWAAPERGLSLAVDASGRVAVGTSAGLYVFGADGGMTEVFHSGHGFIWRVEFVADGVLYAGGDQGLTRVALDDAALPPVGRSGPLSRELWDLPPGCNGEDGCACVDDIYCAPGLTCNCDQAFNCFCGVLDPCLANPGAEGCECRLPAALSPCQEGLACLCEGESCTCQVDPASCGGVAGCACAADVDCALGFACSMDGLCFDTLACAGDCTCPTESGCPSGLGCGMMGCEVPPCEYDCTCETESGCPDGKTCQTWTDADGVEWPMCDYPPECKLDCSCATESGCPDGFACMPRSDGTQFCRAGFGM